MVPPTQTCDVTSTMVPYKLPYRNSNKISKSIKKYQHESCEGVSRNAARERYRVKSLRDAFHSLQKCLPSVPPNTKLSKLDVLILATTYISHLSRILSEDEASQESNGISNLDFDLADDSASLLAENETRNQNWEKSYLHPVRKWPMRSRLYAGVEDDNSTSEQTIGPMTPKQPWI